MDLFSVIRFRIHGIAVCDNAKYFHDHANSIFKQVGFNEAIAQDIMPIIEGYKGRGYGIATQEDYGKKINDL